MIDASEILKVVPFDIIPVDDGILLSRGSIRFQIKGSDAEFIACALADLLSTPTEMGVLLEEFSEPDRENVVAIVDQLVTRGFIIAGGDIDSAVSGEESPEDIFFWHFRESKDAVLEKLSEWRVFLIGVNFMTTYLTERLSRLGAQSITVIDDPTLRNHRFFDVHGQILVDPGTEVVPYESENEWRKLIVNPDKTLLVACSDFGGARTFRLWNEFAVEERLIFMPVAMRGFRAEIGPVVRPDSGACYECYRARENANLEERELVRAGEELEEQSQGRLAGFVDPTLALVSGAAATQILKLLAGIALVEPSSIIYVSTMKPSLSAHKILRVPRCRVCSPTQWRPEVNLKREEFRAKLAKEQQ